MLYQLSYTRGTDPNSHSPSKPFADNQMVGVGFEPT